MVHCPSAFLTVAPAICWNTSSRLNSSQCSVSFPSSVVIESASDWLLDAHELLFPRHFRSSLATTAQLLVLRPDKLSFRQAPGDSRVRPNGRASSTSCAGLGAGEHFATAEKYSSSPPGVITNTK